MADNEALGSLLSKIVVDLTDMKRDLASGRSEMQSFKSAAADVGASVKKALAFAGVAVGIYEIASALKNFGASVLDTGGRIEVLRGAMYAVGENYKMSAGALDLYVAKLQQMGVSTENAIQSINNFLKAGISVDLLPQLATAAKNLAPTMAMSFQDAFAAITMSVAKGAPLALNEMLPGIRQAMLAASTNAKGILDETILSAKEKSKLIADFVIATGAKAEGAAASFAQTYMKQLSDLARVTREAKEALFEFLKPVSAAILGAQVTSWQELNQWVVNNRTSLVQLSEILVVYINKGVSSIKTTIEIIATFKGLFKALLEVWGVMKVLSWVAITEGAAAATLAIGGTIGKLGALRLALAGPWGLVIAVLVIGLYEAMQAINAVVKKTPSVGTSMLMGDVAEGAASGQQRDELFAQGQAQDEEAAEDRAFEQRLKEAEANISRMSPSEQTRKGAKPTLEEALRQALIAAGLGGGEGVGKTPKGGGKGGGAKETTDSLLAPTQALYKAQRDAALQHYQNLFDLLKTSNEKEKAELERKLAAGLIDGKEYYQALQNLQQKETTAALAMIEEKKAAQQKAYQESLTQLDADSKLSDAAKSIARQKLKVENKKSLDKLDTEALQARIDGEKKITDELKRQVEVRKQYQQKTEDLNLETAELSRAISAQGAKLQRLILDSGRERQTAIDKGGMTPELDAAMSANLRARQFDVKYGEMMNSVGSEFSSGVVNIVNGIRQGTLDIGKTLTDMFNNIMMAVLKPGFDALGTALTNVISWLVKSAASAMGMSVGGGGPGTSGYDYQPGGYGFKNWAHGGAFSHGVRQAFAGGGIVTRPTLFPMATGQGLMGEAGAEGILPLARVGGDLGVKALFPQAAATPVTVTVNNNAPRTQASAEQQPNGDVVVTIDELTGKAYARRGTLYKLINQGDKATRR